QVYGWINQELKLSVREWTCKNGHPLDMDENAAKNILNEGLKIKSSGTGEDGWRLKSDFFPEAQVCETRSPFVFSKWVVHRVESDTEPASDEAANQLRIKRLHLKDEIYKFLQDN